MINSIRSRSILTGLVFMFFLLPATVQAHSFWINATDFLPEYREKFGAKSVVYFGYGHQYPVHDFLEPERLEAFVHVSPDGGRADLTPGSGGFLATKVELKQPGIHVIGASVKPGFYTMYEKDGRVRHAIEPKTGLENVIKSVYHHRFAKALLTAGNPAADGFFEPVGHKVEILPQTNPAELRIGNMLPLQILLDGKPARYFAVHATYSGFSSNDDFAYATKTDANGMAEIRILHHGPWLIRADNYMKPPPELADQCDYLHYTATLTFEVR